MKIGACQPNTRLGQQQTNFDTVKRLLTGCQLDLIVLPELFATGYLLTSKEQVRAQAEQIPDGVTCRFLREIARDKQAYIVAGLIEAEAGSLFNAAVLIGPDGYLGKHRKVYLPMQEALYFDPGDFYGSYEILGVKVGVLLCYDAWSPSAWQDLARAGVELVCHPANYCGLDGLEISRQNARQFRTPVVVSNRVGKDWSTGVDVRFAGHSAVIDQEGRVAQQLQDEEGVVICDLEL